MMVCLLLFCGVAMNACKAPTSMETAFPGERMMLAGTGNPTGVLLLPPQPASAPMKIRLIMIANEKKTDRPIHPPHPAVVRGECSLWWKISSVEGENLFSKLRRLRGVRAARRNPEQSEGSLNFKDHVGCLIGVSVILMRYNDVVQLVVCRHPHPSSQSDAGQRG